MAGISIKPILERAEPAYKNVGLNKKTREGLVLYIAGIAKELGNLSHFRKSRSMYFPNPDVCRFVDLAIEDLDNVINSDLDVLRDLFEDKKEVPNLFDVITGLLDFYTMEDHTGSNNSLFFSCERAVKDKQVSRVLQTTKIWPLFLETFVDLGIGNDRAYYMAVLSYLYAWIKGLQIDVVPSFPRTPEGALNREWLACHKLLRRERIKDREILSEMKRNPKLADAILRYGQSCIERAGADKGP
jgi:hypothetical protein